LRREWKNAAFLERQRQATGSISECRNRQLTTNNLRQSARRRRHGQQRLSRGLAHCLAAAGATAEAAIDVPGMLCDDASQKRRPARTATDDRVRRAHRHRSSTRAQTVPAATAAAAAHPSGSPAIVVVGLRPPGSCAVLWTGAENGRWIFK